MYRIKANGNYNLVISDIKISISAIQINGIVVDKDKIDNSKNAQNLITSNLLLVEDYNDEHAELEQISEVNSNVVFVVEGEEISNPSDVFVKTPDSVKEPEVKVVSSKNIDSVKLESTPILVANNLDEITTDEITIEKVTLVESVNETLKNEVVITDEVSKEKNDGKVKVSQEKSPIVKKQFGNTKNK